MCSVVSHVVLFAMSPCSHHHPPSPSGQCYPGNSLHPTCPPALYPSVWSVSFKCWWTFSSLYLPRCFSSTGVGLNRSSSSSRCISLSALLWHSVLISFSLTVDHRRGRGSDPSLCLDFQEPQTEPVLSNIKCDCSSSDIWSSYKETLYSEFNIKSIRKMVKLVYIYLIL